MLDIDPLRDGATPVAAATVILLRDGPTGLEIFLVQRHHRTQFMGGATVFPGGKLDPADATPSVLRRVEGLDEASACARLGESTGPEALALHVAAIRETFEESGVLLAKSDRALDLDRMRTTLEKPDTFVGLVEDNDLTLLGELLVPLSRWVTPAVEKRRFDARFFITAVPADTRAAHDEKETIAGAWLRADEAIRRHHEAAIDLPPPTLRTLELLLPFARAEEAVDAARRVAPPLVRPVFRDLNGQWVLALPGDPEHPETEAVLAGPTRFSAREARWFSG